MNGGDVSNNISIMGNGAGIANKGSLYISGGAVFEENTATGTGGAIMNYELTKTVDSRTFVSFVILSDNTHNNPDACASTPTTGSPSYKLGSRKTSNEENIFCTSCCCNFVVMYS